MRRALITGVTGQDGAYLAQYLVSQGYEVFGAYRRSAQPNDWRLKYLDTDVQFVPFELLEYENVRKTIKRLDPHEIYNLGAQSFVKESFDQPLYTCDVNGLGVLRILEAIRGTDIRLYQASTSEMFGNGAPPQSEKTRFVPRSPYGCGKLLAHSLCNNYRDAYGVQVSCGILFNHESPLRGKEFVTQKIAQGIWGDEIRLGNLEAKRDWGHAKDYVRAMHLMLQHEPDDFVVATGESHTVGDFVEMAGRVVTGTGNKPAKVIIDPKFYRPAEVDYLMGDPTKIKEKLGWKPEISFWQLVYEMTQEGRHAQSVHRVRS
jgi:GDPmannose 4,6-dehydratase